MDNIPRVLPGNCDVVIRKGSWEMLPIFKMIEAKGGVPDEELYQVFNMGIGMVAVEQRIEYNRELLAGDRITIRSWFQEVREKALLFVHEMTNDETQELAARTYLTGVCLDTNTRKARPLPADVRERIVIVERAQG